MSKKLNILVAVLNWGLGHASRMLPVIRLLEEQGAVPIIASDGRALMLLQKEMPHLQFIDLKSTEILYPDSGSMAWAMIRQTPMILKNIWAEHRETERIVKKYKIDGVISDNRFGMWSNVVPSVFVTHQVFIQVPPQHQWLSPIIFRINHYFINQYKECWIPDFPTEPNLSGKLAHSRSLDTSRFKFIGPLSRLKKENVTFLYDLLILLSGPEPQRSIFETKLKKQLIPYQGKVVLVRGITESNHIENQGNITIYDHLTTEKINYLMNRSRIVICRSGYSSLMDLVTLEKNAILIPTSGQTEQEYLATHFKEREIFNSYPQNQFEVVIALRNSQKYTGWINAETTPNLLVNNILKFLQFIVINRI